MGLRALCCVLTIHVTIGTIEWAQQQTHHRPADERKFKLLRKDTSTPNALGTDTAPAAPQGQFLTYTDVLALRKNSIDEGNNGALSVVPAIAGHDVETTAASLSVSHLPYTAAKKESFYRLQELPMHSQQHAACALPAGAKWCTASGGGKTWEMAVYDGKDPVSESICSTGYWEFDSPASMGASSSGTSFVDIGANIGWYTFMYAQHGYNVLAVEPMTANRALINATLCKNPDVASRISVVAAALTDKATPGATCKIFSADINVGDGVLACGDAQVAELKNAQHNNAQIQHVERETVPLTTLDQVLASSKATSVDTVKMDVERYECFVLSGGSTLFSRFHPKGLMIEARGNGKTQSSAGDVVGNTVHCTVATVMQGGTYHLREKSLSGPLISEPTEGGTFNLFFTLTAN